MAFSLFNPHTAFQRYLLVLISGLVLVGIEFFGGHALGSATLVADMFHALTHVAGALIAIGIIVAMHFLRPLASYEEWARILGTAVLAVFMLYLAIQTLFGAIEFQHDTHVHVVYSLGISLVAIAINYYQHRVLKHDHSDTMIYHHNHDILCSGLRTHIVADMLKNIILFTVPILEWYSGNSNIDMYGAYTVVFIFFASAIILIFNVIGHMIEQWEQV